MLADALRKLKPLKGMEISEQNGVIHIRHDAPIAVFEPLEKVAQQHGYMITRRGRDFEREPQFYVRLEERKTR